MCVSDRWVVIQVALALVLLICSGLMICTFRALTRVSPGFSDPNTIASFDIFIPTSQVPDTNRIDVLRMQQAIVNQLATVHGVSSVAISTSLPMLPNPSLDSLYASDRAYKEGDMPPLSVEKFVSPGFFKTMGVPLVAGRDMTWEEELQKWPVVIVSENLARKYWGSSTAAIGKLVHLGSNEPWHEVIGVAGDMHDNGVNQDPPTAVYWGLFQEKFATQKELVRRYVHYVIRTPRAGSASFFSDSERAVWSVNHDLPLAYSKTLGELYTKSMARTSFTLVLLSVAGAMTLLLGIIGLYGVIAYSISQCTHCARSKTVHCELNRWTNFLNCLGRFSTDGRHRGERNPLYRTIHHGLQLSVILHFTLFGQTLLGITGDYQVRSRMASCG